MNENCGRGPEMSRDNNSVLQESIRRKLICLTAMSCEKSNKARDGQELDDNVICHGDAGDV